MSEPYIFGGRNDGDLASRYINAPRRARSPSNASRRQYDERETILLQIEVDSVPQWKVFRDDEGMYTLCNQRTQPHSPAHLLLPVKLTATYDELAQAINNLAIRRPRPGVRGIENSPNLHLVETDEQGRGPGIARLAQQVKVSSEISLVSVGILGDVPGGGTGYVEIEREEGHCEMALRFIEKRGWKDVIVANYVETGTVWRF